MSTLFDAEEARDAALQQVAAGAGRWMDRARPVVLQVAEGRFDFTTDDVWYALGDDRPREPRALGALMRSLAKDGAIRATGEYRKSVRVDCHARPVAVWRKVL